MKRQTFTQKTPYRKLTSHQQFIPCRKISSIIKNKFLPFGHLTGITLLIRKYGYLKLNLFALEFHCTKLTPREIVLTRLGIGHSKLTHGHLISKLPPPYYSLCGENNLTIDHLFTCPLTSQARTHF